MKNEVSWERDFSRGVRQRLLAIHERTPLDIVEVPEYNGLAFELYPPLPFPVVLHFHTPTVLVDRYNAVKITRHRKQWHAFEEKAGRNAFAFRCPSIALAREMSGLYGIAEHAIAILHHPFDTTVFDAIGKKEKTASIDILFVGRLERRKGAEILLRTLQRILSLDPRIGFTFAGEYAIGEMDMFRGAIERSLSEADRRRVWFLGPAKHAKLPILYCRSDLLCFPSLFENAPFTLLEAMASKLGIVASNTGGIPELVRHGENGLLFDPEKPDTLVERIKEAIDNPQQTAMRASAAYSMLQNDFNPEKIRAQVLDFFGSVIASFRDKTLR
jgi:glycosyltransferase involved in cell wall biosynthesis